MRSSTDYKEMVLDPNSISCVLQGACVDSCVDIISQIRLLRSISRNKDT
jgi:hypothetical protein